MNKKAEIATMAMIWIILGIVAALYVGNQAGLFTLFEPVNPPEAQGKPSSLINNYYYEAVNTDYDCQTNPLTIRADSSTTPTWVVRYRSGSLVGFTSNGIVTDPSKTQITGTNFYENGNNIYLLKGSRQVAYTCCHASNCCGTNCVYDSCCPASSTCHNTVYDYYQLSLNNDGVSSQYKSTSPVIGTYEVWDSIGNNPYIWGSPSYRCVGNNIYSVYCKQNGTSSLITTCEFGQACQFILKSNTINIPILAGSYDSVKCGNPEQFYKPDKQLCDVEFSGYIQTDLNGFTAPFISCPTSSGGQCVQLTNTENSKTAKCTECGGTNQKCSNDNLIAYDCAGDGTWRVKENCPTNWFCQMVNGVASCSSTLQANAVRCIDTDSDGILDQRQKVNAALTDYENNGVKCTNGCVADASKCEDKCTWNNWERCFGGTLSYCEKHNTAPDDSGNIVQPITKGCAYGTCEDPSNPLLSKESGIKCFKKYYENQKYCTDDYTKNQIQKGEPDTSVDADLLSRGVKLNPLHTCSDLSGGCTDASVQLGLNGQCKPITKCQNKPSGTRVCTDLGSNTIGYCNEYLDGIIDLPNCPSNNICDASPETLASNNGNAKCIARAPECSGSKSCRDNKIWACDGSYWTGTTYIDDCANNGCTETEPGKPQCNPDPICTNTSFTTSFFGCEGSFSWPCNVVDTTPNGDWDNKKIVKGSTGTQLDCGSTSCKVTSSSSDRCTTQCSGTQTCEGDNVVGCNSLGQKTGIILYSCNGLGCSGSSCISACGGPNNLNGIPDGYSCSGNNSRNCFFNDTTSQRLLTTTNCQNGCNSATGQCANQCNGDKICQNGIIYGCVSNTINLDNIIDSCNNNGCQNTNPIVCNNECNNPGLYRCSTDLSSSILCTTAANTTTNQLIEQTISCGQLGCNSNLGTCSGSIYKNSFDCNPNGRNDDELLRDIWRTDADGKLVEFKKTCVSPNPTPLSSTGLKSYCKGNVSECTYCEKNAYYCVNGKTFFQCENELTGEAYASSTIFCEAGCSTNPNKCDFLSLSVEGVSSFPTGENNLGDISLKLILTGSNSFNPIKDATASAVLIGTGISESPVTGLKSDINGRLTPIEFNNKPKGVYTVVVTVAGYTINNVQNFTVVVTDDLIINPYGIQVAYLIPGEIPTLEIQTKKKDVSVEAQSLVVSRSPNITVNIIGKNPTDKTRWKISFPGNPAPGKYTIGLKPSSGGISLDDITEQPWNIEIRKPKITATTNIPDSTTTGKKEYTLQISGQRIDNGVLTTGPIAPDTIPTATITFNSQTSPLTLLDQGGGSYLVDYTFNSVGTYTINIEATKTGYDNTEAKISKTIQISKSGTEAPPATDGSGNASTSVSTSIGGISTTTIILVIVVGAAVYLIATRRKR